MISLFFCVNDPLPQALYLCPGDNQHQQAFFISFFNSTIFSKLAVDELDIVLGLSQFSSQILPFLESKLMNKTVSITGKGFLTG
jgi:hypothetical protein